ncbi:TetR/AcrR family transcriptional regulator [Streptantibioticus cattleyicolor]|uniref:TetR family transcriptional regulator n=1 Tax=Streptantibioticus cattleyicolor (strain ATCC 35852 / DSM 46488 / JCM 4925 / NBRC 14057 / NRRL 8057) TaxID=1003195 RepID=F8JKG4_STREN|nr:TetR/AcrR family transcriptional regulator [Streptantibioticus cattleyicolor]AEW99770.1 TetR family transcriptional regulator [Streptantibioticus cattleyicolor NRRL 8057 = DSM 46488]CCB71193.1 putative tetR-family transcriptional regulator [Streptantibioticus cattleyicolor NRRL 8057 = DSM 46488]
MTGRLPHPARSDARDNRARILDAARAVFGEKGLDVPMREVARHANVGPATLYRHFPTKRDLIAETFAEQRRACHAIVRDALADPDPWHGFRSLVERICELHAHSRGFADAFMTAFPEAMDFAADRERTLRAVTVLARRARDTGRLRPGFVVDDLVLMLMAHRGVGDTPRADRLTASRRFAAYMIEAFRAAPETETPAPLPSAPRLRSAPTREAP